jgi:Tfp pilus assembly protein PilV
MGCAVKKRVADDAGFSVAEVVVAAAILFFAMTALIGLLGASTSMGASAKGKTVLTNVLSSEMDKIRAMPFGQVGVKNVDAGGALVSPSSPVSTLGYSVVMTYRVTVLTTPDGSTIKQVQIVAVGTRSGEPSVRSMSTMEVRDVEAATADTGGGGEEGGGGSGLTIEFTPTTPPSMSILEGDRSKGIDGTQNQDLWIEARARSASGTISKFEFTVTSGGPEMLLRSGNTKFDPKASYVLPSGADGDETWKFKWNTLQVDDNGVPQVSDGTRQVSIVAWDDSGNPSAPAARNFIVDNTAPQVQPGGIKLESLCDLTTMSQTLKLDWANVMDGTDPAPYYEGQLYKNTNGSSFADFSTWPLAPLYQTPQTIVAGPLEAYGFRARALSPLSRPGPWGNASPATVLTRMPLTGDYDVRCQSGSTSARRNWRYITRLLIKKPGITYNAATLSVKMVRTGSATTNTNGSAAGIASPIDITEDVKAAWAAGNNYSWTETTYKDLHKNDHPTDYMPRYQLQLAITPTGSTAQAINSNIALPKDDYGLAVGAELTNQGLSYTAGTGTTW